MTTNEIESKMIQGISHLANREFDLAESFFSELTSSYPDRGITWLYLGDTLLLLDKIEEAKSAHKKAAELDSELWFPRLITTHSSQAVELHVMLGDYSGRVLAAKDSLPSHQDPMTFQRTFSLLALSSGIQLQAGVAVASYIELFREHLENDIERLKIELEKNSSRIGIWREYAVTLEIMDKLSDANQAYASALRIDPRDRLCQRGFFRTNRFINNEERYGRFAKHKAVRTGLEVYEKASEAGEPVRKKPTELMATIEVIQIAGNSGFIHKEFRNQ